MSPPRTTMPAWLRQHLITLGRWNIDGITRHPQHRTCRTCGADTITALDDPYCAGPAITDPTPLSPLGEAIALIAGNSTYTLERRAGRLELNHRNQWTIAAHPPGTQNVDVLTDHQCNTSYPPALTTESRIPPPTTHPERNSHAQHDPPY